MMYRVLLSCRDCTGNDPQGCFEGGTEYLDDGKTFDSFDAATAAGRFEVKDGIWEFEVVNEAGDPVTTAAASANPPAKP